MGWLIISQQTKGNHIMGSDLQYTSRGNDTFDFTLIVYKDCKGVSLSPVILHFQGIGCSYSKGYFMSQVSCDDITPISKKACTKCNKSSCNAYGYPNGADSTCTFPYGIEKIVYKLTIVFTNNSCCKMRVSYTQCCRNNISTGCSADNFYTYAEFDRCLSVSNNSPVFSNDPVGMFCVGNCMYYNISGRDTAESDSISYHITAPLADSGTACTYINQYTYKYPLYYDGFPSIKKFNPTTCKGFYLDSVTGDLGFKPMQQQSFAMTAEVKEWRKDKNGIMQQIGLVRREMQYIIVANCTNKPPSLPSGTLTGCAGDIICMYGIQSSDPDKKDTVRLSWNYGIPNGIFTAKYNGSKKQEFDFCWQTNENDASNTPYFFTVKATDDASSISGIFSRSYSIIVQKKPKVQTHIADSGCGYLKLATTPKNWNKAKETFTYKWTVGGRTYNTLDTNIAIQLEKGGQTTTQLDVGLNGCYNTYFDTIYIPAFLNVNAGPDISQCSNDTPTLEAIGADSFEWTDMATGTIIYIGQKFKNYFTANTSLIVRGYTTTHGAVCKYLDTLNIKVGTTPNISLSWSNDTLYASNTNGAKYIWYHDSVLIGTTKVPRLPINQIGYYKVTIIDSNGCENTSTTIHVFALKSSIYNPSNIAGIYIYPNPSTGIYYIESQNTINDITIYDLTGRNIYYNTANNNNTIDLSGQPEGIYLLQLNKSVWVKISKQ